MRSLGYVGLLYGFCKVYDVDLLQGSDNGNYPAENVLE